MDKSAFNKKRQEKRKIIWVSKYKNKLRKFDGIDTTKLAYAAGILDGEGCIIIAKGNPKKGVRLTPQYSLKVIVGMSNPSATSWLFETFGGNLKLKPNHQYKPVHTWSCLSIQAEGFLRCILPYLKVKRIEAELALDFREHINNYIRKNGRIIDKTEIEKRETYKIKLQELKRG